MGFAYVAIITHVRPPFSIGQESEQWNRKESCAQHVKQKKKNTKSDKYICMKGDRERKELNTIAREHKKKVVIAIINGN